mmetsp:Transcript_6365/g.9648  ORF Transcript_6365/g.9648 Transcript_6365/m.9648 type:complete len:461 (-) Transcript_6365:208-1590(-)
MGLQRKNKEIESVTHCIFQAQEMPTLKQRDTFLGLKMAKRMTDRRRLQQQRGTRLVQLTTAVVIACSVVSTVTSFTIPSTRLVVGTCVEKGPRHFLPTRLSRGWLSRRSSFVLSQSDSSPEISERPKAKDLPPIHESNTKSLPHTLPNGGQITLVGSGPGDPDLLTVAAHKLLTNDNNKETLIISDRLVSQEILDIISPSMEVKVANKYPGCQAQAQEEIYHWCYDGLKAGKHVVRLKIGDPFVFGRGGEEVLMFRKYGVQPEVIPGVSAAFSAPLLGSIPVTHRGVSNQVVMCTGYGRENTSPDLIQYHPEQTVVFLMAVGRLRTLCERLQSLANYPSTVPVAIVENAGRPFQRTIVGSIENIADIAEAAKVVPPSTIVVGDVVRVLLEDENGIIAEKTNGVMDMIKEAETQKVTMATTVATAPTVEVLAKKRGQETTTVVTMNGVGHDAMPRNESMAI